MWIMKKASTGVPRKVQEYFPFLPLTIIKKFSVFPEAACEGYSERITQRGGLLGGHLEWT